MQSMRAASSITSRASLGVVALLLAATAALQPLSAQLLRGSVRDSASNGPIAGAVLNSSINLAFQRVGHQTAKDYFRRLLLEERYGEELVAYAISQEIEAIRRN